MSNIIVIGIGGTGAKCLEALVHLSAIGVGPDEIRILDIDPDASNGNLEKLKYSIAHYSSCHDIVKGADSIFKTKIIASEEAIGWAPGVIPGMSLAEYFSYDLLKINNPGLSYICDLLYSKDELYLKWDRGFCGRTSIGAPIMASIAENLNKEPWLSIINAIDERLKKGEEARVFIVASIFGATGASAFPIIPEILRKQFPNEDSLIIGGAMLLPYFAFSIPKRNKGVFSSPNDFYAKTKAVLKHYSYFWRKNKNPYDSLYVVGERNLDSLEGEAKRKFADGGPEQSNYSHYIELLAALACLDFSSREKNKLLRQAAAAREVDVLEWGDLTFQNLDKKMISFVSMAISYKVFFSKLFKNQDFLSNSYLAPWYLDLVRKYESGLNENVLDVFDRYFQEHLRWFKELLSSTELQLELINRNAIIELAKNGYNYLSDEYFRSLLAKKHPKCKYGYDTIWDKLCEQEINVISGPGNIEGKFISMLYNACADYYTENYS